MSRPASRNEKVRLSLVLTSRAKERLERLQEMTDADSMSEVVRRALIAYELLLQNQQDGGRAVLENGDGETDRVVLV